MPRLTCGNWFHRSRLATRLPLLLAMELASFVCSMVAGHLGVSKSLNTSTPLEAFVDGPVYLQHMQARILCLSDCERVLYISNGDLPDSLLLRVHIFSNHSSSLDLNKRNTTESCAVQLAVLRNGLLFGSSEIQLPPLYHIIQMTVTFGDPALFRSTDTKLQTLIFHFDVEITSWKCASHRDEEVPPAPVRIGSGSVFVRWAPTFIQDSSDLDHQTAASPHSLDMESAVMVSWMMSLKRRPERWEWGRVSAARAGLHVARWLVVDGRREDVRQCIDSETAYARALDVKSIQPYTALAAALSHKMLHRAIAEHGALAGLSASPEPLAGREHGPGLSSSLSCDTLLAPVNISRSVDTHADWVVIVEDDLLPTVTQDDLFMVMSAIPLNFDLVWLGHCPCNWNGPAALRGEVAPVVSVSVSLGKVVQLWRGSASCLHAYAVNPSSTHVTSSLINLFDGVQWKPACEGRLIRCLVAVVVQFDAAAHVRYINGLPGMFDQNKELVSEIHKAPL